MTPTLDNLIKSLQILPSVGQKSAQRMAIYLLTKNRSQGIQLAKDMDTALRQIKECRVCHALSDDDVCTICQDPKRADNLLCVVETATDVMAIEQSLAYQGRYFVLGGHLSPIDGINAEDLYIDELVHHVKHACIDEVIIATGATVEGQTTAFFVHDAIKAHVPKITRLAQGMPMGGELGYVDSLTLHQALQHRGKFE